MNIAAALSPDLYCCCCTSSLDEEVKDTPSAGYAGLSLLDIADCVTAPAHCTLLYIYIGFPVVFLSRTGTTSFEQLASVLPTTTPTEASSVVGEVEVDTMMKQGITEPSASAYSSPIIMVKKKDGSTSFC